MEGSGVEQREDHGRERSGSGGRIAMKSWCRRRRRNRAGGKGVRSRRRIRRRIRRRNGRDGRRRSHRVGWSGGDSGIRTLPPTEYKCKLTKG